MRFGYMVDTHAGPIGQAVPDGQQCADFWDTLLEEGVAAESVGFDGVFVPERHARSETLIPTPLMLLMALATRTSRITLGTFVLQPAYYNPIHLAEAAAALDVASRGRLVLGLGAGYHRGYFDHFGEPFDDRGARFEEGLEILRLAWRAERFDWAGKHWNLSGALVTPRPVQDGGPPLWLAGTTERTLLRAAQRGDGVALISVSTPLPQIRTWVVDYRANCLAASTDPKVAIVFDGYIGSDDDEALDTYTRLMAADQRTDYYSRWGMRTGGMVSSAPITQVDHVIVGGSARATNQVQHIVDTLGLSRTDWLIFKTRTPQGPESADVLASLRRFGTEVIAGYRSGL